MIWIVAYSPYKASADTNSPPKLEEIISKALDKDRTRRFQSAADARTELHRLKHDTESVRSPADARMETAIGFPRRWRVILPIAVLLVALAASSYVYFHRTPKLTDKDVIVLADFANSTGDRRAFAVSPVAHRAEAPQSPIVRSAR